MARVQGESAAEAARIFARVNAANEGELAGLRSANEVLEAANKDIEAANRGLSAANTGLDAASKDLAAANTKKAREAADGSRECEARHAGQLAALRRLLEEGHRSYTLHPTPYTLHPAPYALLSAAERRGDNFKGFKDFNLEAKGQNLALAVWCVPNSLYSGRGDTGSGFGFREYQCLL